ncbi:MAG: hypothetical protein CVV24_11220, partial [Ignavibacteriae bacterium HGW-Ignavibacteriae-3]
NQLLITLSRNKLLKNADISKIDIRGIRGRLITIGEGEILYREGDVADIIYLVTSGEINILKKRLLGKTKSYIFSENDFFGHEEYFEETSRTSAAVALRDSYLIALNRDEIELLIKQDDEILINLREPIAEIDEETMFNQKSDKVSSGRDVDNKVLTFEEVCWAPGFEEKPVSPDLSIINVESVPQELSDTFTDPGTEKEEETPKIKESVPPEPATPPSKKTGEFIFDESAFLNEDGIPKAEFELPDEQISSDDQIVQKDDDLNDAMFNILSRNTAERLEQRKTFEETAERKNIAAPDENFEAKEGEPVRPDFSPAEIPDEVNPPEKEPETTFRSSYSEDIIKPVFDSETDLAAPETNENIDPVIENFEELKNPDEKIPQPEFQLPDPPGDLDGGSLSTDELQMVIQAAELVNSNIRVDEVLKNIVTVAKDLTHADRGTLYLVDKEKKELWSLITLGDEMREIRLKIGDGLAGYVAQSGETINIKNARTDSRFNPEFDKESGYTTKDMICFPIKNNKSEITGVLQLLNSSKGEFTKRDEEFLSALSIHSAIAINNAELVEKLLQVERVQSLGKMANFLIQDIKKPILVSKRYAEHLRNKSLPPDTLSILDMLLEQLSQVADLVQTTSNYSEGKTILRTLNVSLNNTLSEFASRIEQYVSGRNCEILPDYDKDTTVKLDTKEFYQVYQHIIKNACDAMPEGGKIYLSTKRSDKKVEIIFKDNGLGIPDGFKEKIFEPFMTLGKKEGTGLGLSITRKIIEAHNGTISAEGSIGEGTSFIVTLPIVSVF